MIEIIPSLSILDGKTVRLVKGNYADKTVYKETPLEFAMRFEEHGIRRLHLIDLDGAKDRTVVNYPTLQLISGHTQLKIDFGGGVQSFGDVSKAFEYGAKMVTVGSVAAVNRDLFSSWIVSYGRSKIILSADSLHGKISVSGRLKNTQIDLYEHINYYYERSIMYLKCADVAQDGGLQSPNFDLYKRLQQQFPNLKIFASGGVKSIDDIKKLNDMGIYGVIVGKAYYDGHISLKDIENLIAQN
jgi:phosphoribosylformimino-5-aminoimidazole carboxamide ribotide isomerase